MEQPSSGLTPHRVVAERVRELRTRNGWSAQRLAEEMSAVGIPWERQVVTKLETGRRQSITVEELLALAYVLNVAPVHLLVPTDDETGQARYQITPKNTPLLRLDVVRGWIRGHKPVRLMSTGVVDGRRYFAEVPRGEHGIRFAWVPSTRAEAMEMRAALDDVIAHERYRPGADPFWPEEDDDG